MATCIFPWLEAGAYFHVVTSDIIVLGENKNQAVIESPHSPATLNMKHKIKIVYPKTWLCIMENIWIYQGKQQS